jgi:hypothetical protein
MKISKAMTLLVLACLAINISGCAKQNAVSAEFLILVKLQIDRDIEDLACVNALYFPFSSRARPNERCFGCDKFVMAGLLTKEEVEDPFASDTPERYRSKPDIRLELTELGNSAYEPGDEASPHSKDQPRFCFGRAHVKEITHVYGPVMNGDVKMYGIRYIAELEDPNPFLLDPRAKVLEIPLPLKGQMAAGKTVLYPERNVTVAFPSNNPRDFTLLDIKIGP